MKNTALILWTMILVAAVAGYGIFTMARNMQQLRQPHGVSVDYRELAKNKHLAAKDFVLTNQDGKLFYSTEELKGKIWILNFFFTSCTQNCHRTNQALAEIQKKFPNDDLMILSISCNPELDSTDILKDYSKKFHPNLKHWQFLTGDFNEINDRIAKQFLMNYKRGDHSDRIAVIGRDGKLLDIVEILKPDQFDKLVTNLRDWLDEPAPLETRPPSDNVNAEPQEKDKKGPQ